jgi:DNA-binding GntR family transcriptional regulator
MRTSEELTYARLRSLILSGGLPVGEFLPQRGLASQVEATIVTLRSALRLLENDGLIENIPKWGVRIPIETEKELRDRYYLREILELGAAAKLLELHRFDSAVLEDLLHFARACDALKPEKPDACRRFAELHASLHIRMAEYSGNELLAKNLERLNLRSMMLSNSQRIWRDQQEYLLENYHENLIKEIFSLPSEKALAALREHIQHGLSKELEAIKEEENT